jgi:hypothetical protein
MASATPTLGPRPLQVSQKELKRILRHQRKTDGRPTADHAVWKGIPVVAAEHDELGMTVVSVAEMVLTAFTGPRPTPTSVAHHRDGNVFHCAAKNLEWREPA